jgi:nucleotide-binding universal stress UspA family protein
MFKNVLVPLDFSSVSLDMLRLVRTLLVDSGAELHLLHIAEEESEFAFHTSADLVVFFEQIEVKRDRWLREIAEELDDEGFQVHVALRKGVASDCILAYAHDHGVDLIALSTVGINPVMRVLVGSTTKRVLRDAKVPVLTAAALALPPEDFAVRRVLVTTDFSEASDAAVEVAVRVAQTWGATVRLLHVIKLPSYIPVLPGEPPLEIPPHAVDAIREHSEAQIRGLVERIGDDRVTYDVITASEHAAAIGAYAQANAADLVIMGRVGRNVMQSLFFGRTTETVVKTSPRPVLVV